MILNNIPLKEFNTFGIQSIAKRFSRFSNKEELDEILRQRNNDSLLVLGGGSNILFTKDFDGLVIRNEIKGFEIIVVQVPSRQENGDYLKSIYAKMESL